MNIQRTLITLCFTSVLIIVFSCQQFERKQTSNGSLSGEELSQIYCTSCHLYPEPVLLDKKTWKNHVLVRMSAYLGIFNDNVQYYDKMPSHWLEPDYGGLRVKQAKIYPDEPLISREQWEKIRDFYLSNAPESISSPGVEDIEEDLKDFEIHTLQKQGHLNPHVTAISIVNQNIYAAIYHSKILKLTKTGLITDSAEIEGMVVDIQRRPNGLSVVDIGSRHGRDLPLGTFSICDDISTLRNGKTKLYWDSLQRPVHVNYADLDNDGSLDIVLCEYGNQLGQLCWYKKNENGSYNRQVLFNDDGSIGTEIRDFDKNGFKDVMLLHANGDEGIDIFYNEDGKNFRREVVLRFSSTNGSTSFELVDWDGDGDEDILYTEGDNGDYVPLLKPHHGIRVFENDGSQNFVELFHLPMNGVYKAKARDFDKDGDVDIAAISFHPNFKKGSKEGFVYFENQGNNEFRPISIPQVADSRWMCIDVGDIDQDGDLDIVLGAFDIKTPEVPDRVAKNWDLKSTPIVLLENVANKVVDED
ncbi:MAG: VCBS repeat-containing protein [Bacteroidia bacterium]|nr:VCBS repeat-containing protein [Bacteroidia bacterium]